MNVNSVSLFKANKFKNAITQLGKSGALLPIVLLEATVDTGRAYNAYKRGGITEMRERITDDVSAGIFWLFGAVGLNKLGNWVGKKFFGIEEPGFSAGVDKARDAMKQGILANPKNSPKKLALFKFGKVASSIAIAIAFIGWGLPKINQAITRRLKNKEITKNQDYPQNSKPDFVTSGAFNKVKNSDIEVKNPQTIENAKNIFEDFKNYRKMSKPSKPSKPSFGFSLNPETIGAIAHKLEHNATWRLGSTDGGILVGRTTNARTFDEGLEYGFRDAVSSYFYLWSTGHVIKMCNHFDKFKGFNTKLDPMSAVIVNNHLAKILKDKKMTINEFNEKVFGTKFEKIPKALKSFDSAKYEKISKTIEKNKGNISVEDFIRLTGVDSNLAEKAKLMSKLQPTINGVAILTDTQAKDVLSKGAIYDPKFLYEVINGYFGKVPKEKGSLIGTIQDKLGFTSIKDIEKLRQNVIDYAQSVTQMAEKQAQKSGGVPEVSIDILKKTAKRNSIFHSSYLLAGLGVSILFLSTIIPKTQYWITKMRTGKDGFPGVECENTNKDKK